MVKMYLSGKFVFAGFINPLLGFLCLLLVLLIRNSALAQDQGDFNILTGSGCAPWMVSFINITTTPDVATFTWDFGDGNAESYGPENAGATIDHTYSTSGDFRIDLLIVTVTGERQEKIRYITIYGVDDATASLSANVVCQGAVTFSNTTNFGVTPGTRTTLWDFGDGSSPTTTTNLTYDYTYPSTQDSLYHVKMTNINQCGLDSAFIDIQVYAINNHISSDVDPLFCTNNNITFSNTGHKNNMTYHWYFPDGFEPTVPTPQYEFSTAGTYTVSMVTEVSNGQGCHDSVSVELDFLPGPKANFTVLYDTTCGQTDASFTNTTTNPQDGWEWDFGNTGSFSGFNPPGTYHYDAPGNYRVQMIAVNSANGCKDTSNQYIFVPSFPKAAFSADNVCLHQPALFFNQAIVDTYTTPILSYDWDFNAEQTASDQNPVITFNTAGTKAVYFAVTTNYCSDDTLMNVVVEDLPHINYSFTPEGGCAPVNVTFDNQTTNAVAYFWNFGDSYSDIAQSPEHLYTTLPLTDTIYTVKMIARTSFGCKDSMWYNIPVLFTPDSKFVSDASNTPVCTIDTAIFTSLTMGAARLQWSFGDGTSGGDSIETHIYQNPDPYFKHFEVALIATAANDCPDTSLSLYVTMYPKPRSKFLYDSVGNCHPASVRFYAPIEEDATYSWDFDDGSTMETTQQDEIDHTFQNTTDGDLIYTVKLVTMSQFNCLDSTERPVVIHYQPDADFTLNPNPVQTLKEVQVTNLTENKANWGYSWLFLGEQESSYNGFQPPVQTFNTYWDITVLLIVESEFGCIDTAIHLLDIVPPPAVLDFIPDTLKGCPPLTVHFTDNSEFTDTTTYLWDFGDRSFSNEVDPVHTFYSAGLTTVILTALSLDGVQLTKDIVIDVFFRPSAAFSYFPETPYVPDQPVKCVPEFPADSLYYLWDFGDGDTAQIESPAHFYQDTGSYIITFIVASENSCSDTLTKPIQTLGTGQLKAPNVFFPGSGGSGGDGTGDGAYIEPGSLDNSVFAPLSEGVLEYHLEIYNRWGERLFSTDMTNYGWTGYYRGKLCKEDVYVWKASGFFSSGEAFNKAGTITLLHNK
jgi:PKD repeat protein